MQQVKWTRRRDHANAVPKRVAEQGAIKNVCGMTLIHILFQNSVPNSQKEPGFYHRNSRSLLFTVVVIWSTQNGHSFDIKAVVRIVTTVFLKDRD